MKIEGTIVSMFKHRGKYLCEITYDRNVSTIQRLFEDEFLNLNEGDSIKLDAKWNSPGYGQSVKILRDKTSWFDTKREAMSFKPGGEEPESVDHLSPFVECDRLNLLIKEKQSQLDFVRNLLEDLLDAPHPELISKARDYIANNPISPATSSDRD